MSPEQFELEVEKLIAQLGARLSSIQIARREYLDSVDGTYEIDVTARFQALDADFLVLIECKHHKNAIKREIVQVLKDRVVSLRAQKGMLFSTSRFQSGAVRYAKHQRIALVLFSEADDVLFVTRQPQSISNRRYKYRAMLAGLERRGESVVYEEINSIEPILRALA